MDHWKMVQFGSFGPIWFNFVQMVHFSFGPMENGPNGPFSPFTMSMEKNTSEKTI